jgi:glycogen debranching enzyme
MADPVPTQVTDRPYGSKYIAIENRLGGIPHYHTLAAWLWLGGWHVVALARMGRLAEAKSLLDRIDGLIVREGVVHEVFGSDGRPLKSFWYSSEAPLTWSAGVIVFAHSCYQRGHCSED